jgi:hypothetical protein
MAPFARSTSLVFGALLCASAGCYRTSDAFVHRWAKLQCVNAKECQPESFDAAFDSVSDCRDRIEDGLQVMIDDFEANGCEYIAEHGRECIHTSYRERKDCGAGAAADVAEACDAVFVCPRDGDASPTLPLALDPPPADAD